MASFYSTEVKPWPPKKDNNKLNNNENDGNKNEEDIFLL